MQIDLFAFDLILVEVVRFPRKESFDRIGSFVQMKRTSSFLRSSTCNATFEGARAAEYSLRDSASESRDLNRNLLSSASLARSLSRNF